MMSKPTKTSPKHEVQSRFTVQWIESEIKKIRQLREWSGFYLRERGGIELRIYASTSLLKRDESGIPLEVNGTWGYRYQLNGKRKVFELGPYPELSLAEAREKALPAKMLVAQKICPKEQAQEEQRLKDEQKEKERIQAEQEKTEKANRLTFSMAIDEWAKLELSRRDDEDGRNDTLRAINKDFLSSLGDRELATITKGELLSRFDQIMMRGAPRMAERTLNDLNQFFRWALERELVASNLLANINKTKMFGRARGRERALSEEEIKELRERIPDAGLTQTLELSIWILLSTLCRSGELIRSKWSQVDFEKRNWHIPKHISKNRIAFDIPLSDFALDKLRGLKALTGWSEWMMPSPRILGAHIGRKTIAQEIGDRQRDKPLQKRSKANQSLLLSGGKWTPHDLRRTSATLMTKVGVLPDIADRCLSHVEQNRMKRIYLRNDYLQERQQAFDKLGEKLEEIIGPGVPPR